MSDLEKYQGEVIEQNTQIIREPDAYDSDGQSNANLTAGVLRRWYLVLLVFVVMCVIGIPMVWLSMEPTYNVTGAIRVAPIISNILTGETDNGEISNYRSFVNTQAAMITSGNVVERVADELSQKNVSFLQKGTSDMKTRLKQEIKGEQVNNELAAILRNAVNSGAISASADKNTELISVTMKSADPQEAKLVVNTFIRNYMAVEGSASAQGEDRNLRVLEDEQKVLAETLKRQRDSIQQLAQEYGSTTLTSRQDMMLERVSFLLGELTKVEAKRINLESQIQQAEKSKDKAINSELLLSMLSEHLNSDPTIQDLNRTLLQLEKELMISKQVLAPTNSKLKYSQQVIDELKKAIERKTEDLTNDFDENIQAKMNEVNQQEIFSVRMELEQTIAYENRLREKLSGEDTHTIEIGRKQLAIQDLQDQMELTKEMHSTIQRRIKELGMERKRPARLSVAYDAELSLVEDKRVKLSIALVCGSLVCGMMLAFLRDKADKSLRTPEDVTRRIGIQIIGTTSNPSTVKRSLLPGQVVEDYQSIRANLGLLSDNGLPKKLVITSPGMAEGKTTCSVNLATSIAKSGKKVLLIDGDLRKPNVHRLLYIPKGTMTVQDMLVGRTDSNAIHTVASSGLDVLVAESQGRLNIYELLASPESFTNTERISMNYDHVIIDTPPALAFPDALIWAKMVDAVILTSFAGKTTASDLKEAKEKMADVNVKVLGTVLSNVSAEHSSYRYSYNYYTNRKTKKGANAKLLMIPEDKESCDSNINES